MKEVKTAMGLCRFTDDALILEERLYYPLIRLIEYNKKWVGVVLFALGLMVFAVFAEGPRTIARLLSFLEYLGWVVLISIGLGLFLGFITLIIKLDRLPSNFVWGTKIEIPWQSVSQVSVKDLSVGITHQTILVGYRKSSSESSAVIQFGVGMDEQFESVVALFEKRGVPVEGR